VNRLLSRIFKKPARFEFTLSEVTSKKSVSNTDIDEFEKFWGVDAPEDLKVFWLKYGSFEGFASGDEDAHYLILEDPMNSVASFGIETKQYLPKGFAPIGSDGAGEMVVLSESVGYGLLAHVHGGVEDYMPVAVDLDEFLSKAAQGSWFEKK